MEKARPDLGPPGDSLDDFWNGIGGNPISPHAPQDQRQENSAWWFAAFGGWLTPR